MDGRALTRLRIGFVLLGAALLLPLALLLRSVDSRLEAQRRLRHELVAERIFDEMEGELTALLAREDARPSDAYVGSSTRVENWAPFVVGYFTRDSRGVQIVAKPQLAAERLHRLEATLKLTGASAPPAPAESSDAAYAPAARLREADEALRKAEEQRGGSVDFLIDDAKREAQGAPAKKVAPETKGLGGAAKSASGPAQQVKPLPEEIIKQLNRAADVREREQTRPAAKRKLSRDDTDPLSGFE